MAAAAEPHAPAVGEREDGPPGAGPEHRRDGDHQQRPEQVVLLLDTERPRVLQRRRRAALREVVGLLCDEGPVRHPEERGDGVVAQCGGGLRREECARRHHRQHHDDQRGQQPSRAPDPEARQRDSPATGQFVEQQRGDQESAEHEEDVDTEEPAGNTGDAAVLGQDEPNRDGADAVQRRDALRPSAMSARGDTDLAHCAKFRGRPTRRIRKARWRCRRLRLRLTSSARCI